MELFIPFHIAQLETSLEKGLLEIGCIMAQSSSGWLGGVEIMVGKGLKNWE